VWLVWYRVKRINSWENQLIATIYNLIEGVTSITEMFIIPLRQSIQNGYQEVIHRLKDFRYLLETSALILVIASCAFLRGYDAFKHTALGFSDSYTILTWLKYLELRTLFHDGIYPQGYPVFLSLIDKFSAGDQFLVVKAAGPISGTLICLSVYFLTSRLMANRMAGVTATFVYGVFGTSIFSRVDRQAAALPQEFGTILVLPLAYLTLKYLRSNEDKKLLFILTAMLSAVGLIHAMAFFFALLAMGMASLAVILLKETNWVKLWGLVKGIMVAGSVSLSPALIGLVMGKEFHTASAEFATYVSSGKIEAMGGIPAFHIITWVALMGAVVWLLIAFFKYPERRSSALFPVLFLGITMLIFRLSYVLDIVAMATRTSELVALATAVGVSCTWRVLEEPFFLKPIWRNLLPLLGAIGIISCLYLYPVTPPVLPKYQYDAEAEQYLRITREYKSSEWLMISEPEGYNLVLANGYHMQLETFVGLSKENDGSYQSEWEFSPYTLRLKCIKEGVSGFKKGQEMKNEYVFIFHQKKLYHSSYLVDEEGTIMARTAQEASIKAWLEAYKSSHQIESKDTTIDERLPHISLYYEDKELEVWLIHQPKSEKEQWQELWGREEK